MSCTSRQPLPTLHVYVYACVYNLSGVHSHNLAGVHLCNIKSTSAGSHSDKTNRTWHFLRWRQMLAPVPLEHFPSRLSSIQITFQFSLRIFPRHLPCLCPQQDLLSPLIWFLILLLQGSVIRRAWVRLKACFMPYWSQLATSTHFHLSRQMTINGDIMYAGSHWYSKLFQ